LSTEEEKNIVGGKFGWKKLMYLEKLVFVVIVYKKNGRWDGNNI